MTAPCDRAELVVKRAINCGWLHPASTNIQQLQGAIRIALDTEVRAGGPWLDDGDLPSPAQYPSPVFKALDEVEALIERATAIRDELVALAATEEEEDA